jgi:hypothetical protein
VNINAESSERRASASQAVKEASRHRQVTETAREIGNSFHVERAGDARIARRIRFLKA